MSDEENSIKILKQRYAKGEITKEEYLDMKEELIKDDNEPVKVYSTKPDGKKSSSIVWGIIKVLFIFIIIGIIVLGAFYFLGSGVLNHFTSSAIQNAGTIAIPTVTVSGIITTQGAGTHPTSITFGSSTVTTDSNGRYSINLQNNNVYQIQVAWSSIGGFTSGTCNAGSLNLQSQSSALMYNVTC